MKLLNASQIREWDQYTIQNEPISSFNLMERAARACAKWMLQNIVSNTYYIFCGKGNNGGDGLAIARLLNNVGKEVKVFVLDADNALGTPDYQTNFHYLQQSGKVPIILVKSDHHFPPIPPDAVIVDALFGTGLNRKLEGLSAALVTYINATEKLIIAIDFPSGMYCDESSVSNAVIKASHTLTFQVLKLAFLFAENADNFGQIHLIDINLHPDFIETINTRFELVNKALATAMYRLRKNFSHKGDYGHALVIAGSIGKMGAAQLCAKAALKSGSGLVTAFVPKKGISIIQTSIPEVMAIESSEKTTIAIVNFDLTKYNAIAIGPGIGTEAAAYDCLNDILKRAATPLVLDADALNIIAQHKELLSIIPANSILTPHSKEFERLFGKTANEFERIEVAIENAKKYNLIIVLKGHHSFIAAPTGEGFFNITGNPGMATAGCGDVLTGMITGLIAQNYLPISAALLGVFLHGLAGDLAAGKLSMEAMLASDIIDNIGNSFLQIQS